MNKALLVGINAYQKIPLDGCVNDVKDVEAFLLKSCGFKPKNIRLLFDSCAKKQDIMQGLAWLLEGLKKGDRVLFYFSGHGALFPGMAQKDGTKGLDDVILPYDYNFGSDKSIHDKELHRMFQNIPKQVAFFWISDSCHSGDLYQAPPVEERRKVKTMPLTPKQAKHVNHAKSTGCQPLTFAGAAKELNIVLLAACKQNQLADDCCFEDGKPNGVLTHFLLRELRKDDALKKPFAEIYKAIRRHLPGGKFKQEPQLEGAEELKKMAFLNVKQAL